MSDDAIYVWVRWRRNSSASYGDWEWQEFAFPADCVTKRKQQEYFKRNHGPELRDQQDSGGEHCRGVEWEFVPVPREVLMRKRKIALATAREYREMARRMLNQGFDAPRQKEQPPIPKKACRQWPKCGCIQQFKHKDCRPPFPTFKFAIREKPHAKS